MASPLASAEVFHLGRLVVTRPVLTTWAIMAILATTGRWATRHLRPLPDRRQAMLELLVGGILEQIEGVLRKDGRPYLPLLGTLFLFIAVANLSGLLPAVEAPTAKFETTAALALIVFVAGPVFGLKTRGARRYLAGFAEPKLFMLPLNLLSEVTRHFSLMLRLFGNVMSGEFVIGVVTALAGLLVPIPLMALEVFVGVVQAYIFTILATVFIGAAIGSTER